MTGRGSLRVLSFDKGILATSRFDEDRRCFTGAAYDASWRLVPESVRPANTVNPDDWRPTDPLHLIGRSGAWAFGTDLNGGVVEANCFSEQIIDGGYLFGPWGHFLIESLSTAWAAHSIPNEAVLIVRPWGPLHGNAVPRRLDVLRAAGWGRRPIVVSDAAWSCHRLYVPERATRYGDPTGVFEPEFRDVIENLRRAIPHGGQSPKRVFLLSPSQPMASQPHIDDIVDRFVSHGFEVLDHENADDPLTGYSPLTGAGVVASFSGSHLHNALVAPAGATVIELSDFDGVFRGASVQMSLADLLGHHLRQVSLKDAPNTSVLDEALGSLP